MMRYLLLSLLFIQVLVGYSQTEGTPISYKGKVVDQVTQEAISFANVALYQTADNVFITGGTTDIGGLFEFQAAQGDVYLKIDFIGSVSYTHLTLPTTPYV